MKELFETIKSRAKEGKQTMLAAVVESKGSVPRSAGAYMLVGEEGRAFGTIGGGRLEYTAILKSKELLKAKKSLICDYSLKNDPGALGMVCGGSALIKYYYIDCSNCAFAEYAAALNKKHKPYWFILPLNEGSAEVRESLDFKGSKGIFEAGGKKYYAEGFGFDGRVYIFGGGHLSREVTPLLNHLGFSVTVIDDRKEFANAELFPQALEVRLLDYDSLENELVINKNDYIAIMTRGHMGDLSCERFALKGPACYIGVVGSRRKIAFVRSCLLAEGFTDKELDRVHTPIGLDIGSETPEEIAVSIAAELIKVRAEKYKNT